MNKCRYVCIVYAYSLHNEQRFVQSVLSGLDWTGLTSDPLSWTGLDQDHRVTDLDWTGFFQMNPFHTLVLKRSLRKFGSRDSTHSKVIAEKWGPKRLDVHSRCPFFTAAPQARNFTFLKPRNCQNCSINWF